MTTYNIPAPTLVVTGDRHVTASWTTPALGIVYSKRAKGTESSLTEYKDYSTTAGGTGHALMNGYTVEYWYKTQPSGAEWIFGQSIDVPASGTLSATFDAPDDALAVRVRVKPKSNHFTDWTYSSYKDADGKRTYTWTSKSKPYFTEGNGYWREHVFAADTPSAPTASAAVNAAATRATVTIAATDADTVAFEVQPMRAGKAEGKVVEVSGTSFTYPLGVGSWYSFKVRAKTARGIVSAWVSTAAVWAAVAVPAIERVTATASDEVEAVLTTSTNASGYEVRYAPTKAGLSADNCPSMSSASRTVRIGGLTTGQRYWFKARAKNQSGVWSDWGASVPGIAGTTPNAPMLYIPTAVGKAYQRLEVSWTHNSTDGSDQTAAQVKIRHAAFGSATFTTITYDYTTETTKDYVFNDARRAYVSVRTMGANGSWSPWSAEYLMRWYPDVTPSITVPDYIDNANLNIAVELPVSIEITRPVAYFIEVCAAQGYEADTPSGTRFVDDDEVLYTTTVRKSATVANITIPTAPWQPVDGQIYYVRATVTLSSGIEYSAESVLIDCQWDSYLAEPDALLYEVADRAMVIQPRCREAVDIAPDGEVTSWVWQECVMDVYRVHSDGTAVLIAENVKNGGTCHDDHPTFNAQRYRIVAKATATGETRYADVSDDSVVCDSVVIQWDERWTDGARKSTYKDDEYVGKALELPYNLKLGETYRPDVALVEYQGRTAPVKYAGTQRGSGLSIACDVEDTDTETVNLLRELAAWPGNAYVRTPNGLGGFYSVEVGVSTGFDTSLYSVTLNCKAVDGKEI